MGTTRFFPRVKEAREKLKEKAEELIQLQMTIVAKALDGGDYETAAKANQWLLEHMPDDDGVKAIDAGIDRPKQIEPSTGPSLMIGFAIGGIPQSQQALPEAPKVIDVTPIEKDDDDAE